MGEGVSKMPGKIAIDHKCDNPEERDFRLGSEKLQNAITRAAIAQVNKVLLSELNRLSLAGK